MMSVHKLVIRGIKQNVKALGLEEDLVFRRVLAMMVAKKSKSSILRQLNDDCRLYLSKADMLPEHQALIAAVKVYLESATLLDSYHLSFITGAEAGDLITIGRALLGGHYDVLLSLASGGNAVAQLAINKIAFERKVAAVPSDAIDGYIRSQRATVADQQSLCALLTIHDSPFAMGLLQRIPFANYTDQTLVILACQQDGMAKSILAAKGKALMEEYAIKYAVPRHRRFQPCMPVALLQSFEVKPENTGLSPAEFRTFSTIISMYDDIGFISRPAIENLKRIRWDDERDPGKTIKRLLDASTTSNAIYVSHLSAMIAGVDSESDIAETVKDIMRHHATYYPFMDILDDILVHGSYSLLCYYTNIMQDQKPDVMDEIVSRIINHYHKHEGHAAWSFLCNRPKCSGSELLLVARIKCYQHVNNIDYAFLYLKQLMALGILEVDTAVHHEIFALAKLIRHGDRAVFINTYLKLLSKMTSAQQCYKTMLLMAQHAETSDMCRSTIYQYIDEAMAKGSLIANPVALRITGIFYRDGIGGEKNGAMANKCFTYAAQQGDVESFELLFPAPHDPKDLFEQAKHGFGAAIKCLWQMTAVGDGNSDNAKRYLVECYAKGWGVRPDKAKALALQRSWFAVEVVTAADCLEATSYTYQSIIHLLAMQSLTRVEDGSRRLSLFNQVRFYLMLIGAVGNPYTVDGVEYAPDGYSASPGLMIISSLVKGYVSEQVPEQADQWHQVIADMSLAANKDTYTLLTEGRIFNQGISWVDWRCNHAVNTSFFMLNDKVYMVYANRGFRGDKEKLHGLSFFEVTDMALLQTKEGLKHLAKNCRRQIYTERTDPAVDDGMGKDLGLRFIGCIKKSAQKGGNCSPIALYNAILSHIIAKQLRAMHEGHAMPDGLTMALIQSAFDAIYYPVYKPFRTFLRQQGMQGIEALSRHHLSKPDREAAIQSIGLFVDKCKLSDVPTTAAKGQYLAVSMREIFAGDGETVGDGCEAASAVESKPAAGS
ncbi:MAG: hypothetical protein P1U40_13865 [Coxiellaceae bacterium]|nr:hypothetical protein [Coxiellaceae bacterium]